jgi:hypothetical protein
MKTVAELIEELKLLPQEALVYGRGYEGGLEDIAEVLLVNVVRDVNKKEYWRGKHEYVDYVFEDTRSGVFLR